MRRERAHSRLMNEEYNLTTEDFVPYAHGRPSRSNSLPYFDSGSSSEEEAASSDASSPTSNGEQRCEERVGLLPDELPVPQAANRA